MKSSENLIELFKGLPYFDKKTLHQMGKHFGLTDNSVDTYISRYLRRNEIIRLKNGLYISSDSYHKNKNNITYIYYLANILRSPSCISSWAALQYYNLTTETIHTITSITPRVTRTYSNKVGIFLFQSIKQGLFTGFHLEKGNFNFFIASPAKSLFDLLYFRTKQLHGLTFKDVDLIIDDLRIDMHEMAEEERDRFYSLIKDFIHE
jgi:predicted transcriptional regulator of viral defense system